MSAPAWEAALAAALCARDPVAALRRAARKLPAGQARMLRAASEDGVRISALLVARLRLHRLLSGSDDAGEWYERDLPGFTEAFRRYHAQVPPTAFFPAGEAALFRAWCTAQVRADAPKRRSSRRGRARRRAAS